uniref:Putative secreted protein n=1 Tax=Panstrongylus lignarius TaxID=156445 RepID=A0A224Y391_9HEMI
MNLWTWKTPVVTEVLQWLFFCKCSRTIHLRQYPPKIYRPKLQIQNIENQKSLPLIILQRLSLVKTLTSINCSLQLHSSMNV